MYDFMKIALEEAHKAMNCDDVPVGAVIVKNGKLIARGYNKRNIENNALLHAEIIVIDDACKKLGTRLLNECDLYVTLEPCPMCAGAIIQSAIRRLYFGAYDPKAGCAGSVTDLFTLPFNSIPEYYGGIMEDECTSLLSLYFKNKR